MPLLDGAIHFLGCRPRTRPWKLSAMNVLPTRSQRLGTAGRELRPQGRAFINGRAVEARDGRVFEDISPIDGSSICAVARCGSAEVEAAVAPRAPASRAAPGGAWSRRTASGCCGASPSSSAPTRRGWRCSRRRDVGKPIVNSVDVDVANCADCIEYYAEFADKLYDEVAPTGPNDLALVRREPLGVVAAIVPWNYPLIISCWKLGPALLTGNSRGAQARRAVTAVAASAWASSPARPACRPGCSTWCRAYGEEAGKALAAAPGRRPHHLHRLDRGRPPHAALRRRVEPQARRARMRRQDPAGGVRRCRPRGGRAATSPGASTTTAARPATPARVSSCTSRRKDELLEGIRRVAATITLGHPLEPTHADGCPDR